MPILIFRRRFVDADTLRFFATATPLFSFAVRRWLATLSLIADIAADSASPLLILLPRFSLLLPAATLLSSYYG